MRGRSATQDGARGPEPAAWTRDGHQPRPAASGCDLQLGLHLAEALARMGRTTDAVQQYGWVAEALEARGDTTLALSTHRLIGSLAPYCMRTQLRCAEVYAQAGHVRDAVAIWDWAAAALAGFGRPLEAADALARAVEAVPEQLERRRRLAEIYAGLGMIDAAVQQLDAIARRLYAAARTDEYVEVAERLLGLRRDHIPTLRGLARVHLHRRDVHRLVACLRGLLGASRRDAVAGELIVETFVMRGRLREAREAAVVVARALVTSTDAFDREIARGLLERARRRNPTDARLRELQEELAAEPIDELSIVAEVTEPEFGEGGRAGGLRAAEVLAAIRDERPSDDGETNVFVLSGWRRSAGSDATRPDVHGSVIQGRFRRVAG